MAKAETSGKSIRRGRPRQQKLAKALVENLAKDKPATIGQLLESVGYPHSTATTYPGQVLQQKGVQAELAILGFDEQTAKEVVGEILKDKTVEPQHRLKAASEIFKVHGTYAAEKSISVHVQVPIENRQYVESVAQKAIEEMKHGEYNA